MRIKAGSTGSDSDIPSAYHYLAANYYDHLQSLTDKITRFNQYKNITPDEMNYFPLTAPRDMLADLEARMQKDFPDIAQLDTYQECLVTVKEVSPSLEDYSAPAYYLTPPIDDVTHNIIYINQKNVPAGISLYTTLAHEGYPGHLYQTTYSQLYQQEKNISSAKWSF